MKKTIFYLLVSLFTAALITNFSTASENKEHKKAIVLASFGTSYPDALKAITNIGNEVKKAFPDVRVKHAFTSNIIRKIWHERQNDENFKKENKNIPGEFLYIKGPLATIADLQDSGYDTIIVQPTLVYEGEEFIDLSSYIDGLNDIKTVKPEFMPFNKLVVGRPALGMMGKKHVYHDDIRAAAKSLSADVAKAKSENAALVYMGHGNEYLCTGAYIEFQNAMTEMYPDTNIFVGTVEGFPTFDNVLKSLKHCGVKKVLLKPFMVVAGDHANNDMAGDEDDSWKEALKKENIDVLCEVKGLGENDKWAAIYVDHISDTMKDNNI